MLCHFRNICLYLFCQLLITSHIFQIFIRYILVYPYPQYLVFLTLWEVLNSFCIRKFQPISFSHCLWLSCWVLKVEIETVWWRRQQSQIYYFCLPFGFHADCNSKSASFLLPSRGKHSGYHMNRHQLKQGVWLQC